MAYRYADREGVELFPRRIEAYVSEDDSVRAYDAMVDSLNLEELGIEWSPHEVGNPSYDPRTMLKFLVYGYSYGIRSSRKLERAGSHNLAFIWLLGGLGPDHKTIAEFRRKNKKALKNVLRECAKICLKLGLIEGNTLFVDGSKIRGNASIKNTWTMEKCRERIKVIDNQIEKILGECEEADRGEEGEGSYGRMKEKLGNRDEARKRIEGIMEELKGDKKNSINTTDPESVRINSLQGTHAGYNAQVVVDEKNGLIVSSDVVSKNNDVEEFAEQIENANETLGKKCQVACADSGYANTEELKKIDEQEIKVIVPSQKTPKERKKNPFDKIHFKYDAEKDRYECPEGHYLNFQHANEKERKKIYRIEDKKHCLACPHFGQCTKEEKNFARKIDLTTGKFYDKELAN